MRLIQHKREAFWFYRFLSVFYDKYVNPLFWTERMRDESLELGRLDQAELTVIDVGSGTGFTTQGIVRQVPARQVTCVDQSPHQMGKARAKADLQDCNFQLGDAENIPFPDDQFDRYVSAGSIEYWPDPQRGITEAYRVIKPGGLALMIGPVEPRDGLSRFLANLWMLFPREEEYRSWYERAGFTDIRIRYIAPEWHRGNGHYGLAIAGTKPKAGPSPLTMAPATEEKMTPLRWITLIVRVIVGSLAGFLFIPIALIGHLQRRLSGKQKDIPENYRERLNAHQITALIIILALLGALIWWVV